ncbi:MAG: adenosine deaminase [Pseudobdellovibrionaceae bacterium]
MMSHSQLRSLPKVELHRHLEGALRLSTVCEVARHIGLPVPQDLVKQKEHYLVTSPMRDLETVLAKFWRSQEILHSEEVLTRITYEAIEDAYNDGIRVLELRYAPTFISQNHANFNYDRIHWAIHRGMVQAMRNYPIAVGLLCTIQRILPFSVNKKVMDFVIHNRDGFIGVDLADNEASYPARDFEDLFMPAKKAGLQITIHAGEANSPKSIKNVHDSIKYLGAERIGHGVQIFRDAATMELVKKNGVTLELCPTSNYYTNAVPGIRAHPFRFLMEKGVKVTLNSDDPGIFDFDLTHEYEVLAKEHSFTIEEFKNLNRIALEATFIPKRQWEKVWPQ